MGNTETAETLQAEEGTQLCQLCQVSHPAGSLKAVRVNANTGKGYANGHVLPVIYRVFRGQFTPVSMRLRLKNARRAIACPRCRHAEAITYKSAMLLQILIYLALGTAMVLALDHFGEGLDKAYSPVRDSFILLGFYLLALLALYRAYQGGGRAWAIRHGMFRHYDKANVESGYPPHGLLSVLQRMTSLDSFWEGDQASGARSAREKLKKRKRDWVFGKSWVDPRQRIDVIIRRRELPVSEKDGEASEEARRPNRLWKTAVSGFWGEALILTIAALAFTIVIWQCSLTSLFVFFNDYKVWTFWVNMVVIFMIIDYCIRQVYEARHQGRTSTYCGHIADAYAAYAFYCWLLFAFGAMMLGVLLSQFIAYDAIFTDAKDSMISTLTAAEITLRGSDNPAAEQVWLSNLEMALGQLSGLNIILQKQMTPIFLVTSLLIIINIAITHTALKDLFLENAKALTAIFTFVPLVCILLICTYIYFRSYDATYSQIELIVAAGARSLTEQTDPEIIKRNAEILAEISRGNTIFGFISAVGGNASGASIFAGIAKLTLDWLDSNRKKIAGTEVVLRDTFKTYRPSSTR
ncbi:MAG: hypothetical protein QM645_06050 [Asticcacaulis sp.]